MIIAKLGRTVANDLPPYVHKKTAKGLTYYYFVRGSQLIRLPDSAMANMPCKVYFIGGDTGPIKIGKSRDPLGRCRDMNVGSPQELRVLATVLGDGALEKAYHRRFGFAHMRGEWFDRHELIVAEIERLTDENKDGQ